MVNQESLTQNYRTKVSAQHTYNGTKDNSGTLGTDKVKNEALLKQGKAKVSSG